MPRAGNAPASCRSSPRLIRKRANWNRSRSRTSPRSPSHRCASAVRSRCSRSVAAYRRGETPIALVNVRCKCARLTPTRAASSSSVGGSSASSSRRQACSSHAGLRIVAAVVRTAAFAGPETGRPRGRGIRKKADVAFERAAALTGRAAIDTRGGDGVEEHAVEGRVALTEGVVVAAVHAPMMLATATSTPPESCAAIRR